MNAQSSSNNTLAARYRETENKLLYLDITYQDEQFNVVPNITNCNVRLLSHQVELVGNPARRPDSVVVDDTQHDVRAAQSVNYLSVGAANDQDKYNHRNYHTVTDMDDTATLFITPKDMITEYNINHGLMDIRIRGMTDTAHHYLEDTNKNAGYHLIVPTDEGLESNKSLTSGPPRFPFDISNVKLQPQITVHTRYHGLSPSTDRDCRFLVEWIEQQERKFQQDPTWAASGLTASPFRPAVELIYNSNSNTGRNVRGRYDSNTHKIVPYMDLTKWPSNYYWDYIGRELDPTDEGKSQLPPNLIRKLLLCFEISPRITL